MIISIVIVEDQTELLNLLRKPLQMSGYQTCNFTNYNFAYDHMKENPDKFSLIISEYSLPHMFRILIL